MSVFTCTCTCDAVLEASCSYMGPRWLIYILSNPIRKPFGYRRSIANVQVAETKETIGNRNYLHQCTRLLVAIPRSFRVSRLLGLNPKKTGVKCIQCLSVVTKSGTGLVRPQLFFWNVHGRCLLYRWSSDSVQLMNCSRKDIPVTVRHMRCRPRRKGPRYDDRSS